MVAPFTSSSVKQGSAPKLHKRATPQGPPSNQNPTPYFECCTTEELIGHSKTVRTVAWSSDGKRLASGSVDKTVRLWEPEQPSKSYKLEGHSDSVDQLCWSPESNHLLATASVDKTVRFWDTRASGSIHVTPTDGENINISWSGNGKTVAVGDKDDRITFINTRHENGKYEFIKAKEWKDNTDSRDELNEICWSLDCKYFFVTTGSCIKILNWPDLTPFHEVKSHTASCYCIDMDPTGKYWATGGADALVFLYDSECIGLASLDYMYYPVRTLSFTHDGVFLASASEDDFIAISNVESPTLQYFKIETKAATNSVAWNPKNYLLAFAGDESSEGKYVGLKIWGYHE